ncbi:fimbrial protein [Zymobacter palmae]|uniref:P pilus assembly protein, pilin FimA n=1 Tax=Zymobacter palmae TaxID=33074 RepID=A0A348HCX1_9GAMM|nr:fimbrial protein [Zymobacter palmae]BBG29473.1 P pilus assembly protein, pilin FimA [Zymobacter palmae]
MKRWLWGLLALTVVTVPVEAADVLIRVTGNVKVNTCELSSAAQEMTVPMKSALLGKARYQIGDVFEPTLFTIGIAKCNSATAKARVTFSGTASTQDSQVLALSEGGASGLGIQLRDAQGTLVGLNQPSSAYALLPDITNTLTFTARYVATDTVLQPGQADAVVDFAIEYE